VHFAVVLVLSCDKTPGQLLCLLQSSDKIVTVITQVDLARACLFIHPFIMRNCCWERYLCWVVQKVPLRSRASKNRIKVY